MFGFKTTITTKTDSGIYISLEFNVLTVARPIDRSELRALERRLRNHCHHLPDEVPTAVQEFRENNYVLEGMSLRALTILEPHRDKV